MKQSSRHLAGLWLAMGAAIACSDEIGLEPVDLTAGSGIAETKATVYTTVTFARNPQYSSVSDGFLIAGEVPSHSSVLDLTVNIPADGTFTGVSVRSVSGAALCGTFSLDEDGSVVSSEDSGSIVFAEFPQTDGTRFYDLAKGASFSFRLHLPPVSYRAGDLVVRLHATGTVIYETTINSGIPAGESLAVNVNLGTLAGNNWLSALPDDALACRLSIPGTHDAATGDGTTFSLGRTQNLTLQEQWDMGIRMFDLRPGYKKVRSGWFRYVDRLHIYHGIVETKTSFEEAMNVLCSNLEANPDEFAVIVMRFENDHFIYNNRDTWNSLMCSFLASASFPAERRVDFRPDITLGELRGKILMLSRDAYASEPSTGGFVSGWSHDASGSTAGIISGSEGSAPLNIQDYYSVGDEAQKLASVKEFADKAATARSGVWTINHTSGYTGSIGSDSGYRNNAANCNPALYGYLVGSERQAGPAGIVVMDHVGARTSGNYTVYGDLLPQALIDNNYKVGLSGE